jgi:hypothetical protein
VNPCISYSKYAPHLFAYKSPFVMFWCVHDVIVLTYSYNGLAEKWVCMLHDNPFCLLFSVQVSINISKYLRQSSAL